MPETSYPTPVADRIPEGTAERDPGILYRVVRPDIKVTRNPDDKVHPRVFSKGMEHVVEKRDPGFNLAPS
jgi:hypothetical protein